MEETIVRQATTVNSIHETLVGYTGKRLRVRANMGRSKIIEREGVLTQAHNSLFIVETIERARPQGASIVPVRRRPDGHCRAHGSRKRAAAVSGVG